MKITSNNVRQTNFLNDRDQASNQQIIGTNAFFVSIRKTINRDSQNFNTGQSDDAREKSLSVPNVFIDGNSPLSGRYEFGKKLPIQQLHPYRMGGCQ